MYLGPMLLFAAFSSLFYVPSFLDIPLSVLTPRELLSELLFAIFALISLTAFARSVECDPVWPWRPEFRQMVNTLLGRAQ